MTKTFTANPNTPRSGTIRKTYGATVRASVDWSAYSSPVIASALIGSGGNVVYTSSAIDGAVASVDVQAGGIGDVETVANIVRLANGRKEAYCLVIVCSRF